LWSSLAAAAQHAVSPDAQYRYLYALGAFTDPGLVQRGLDYVLTPNVRTQNAGRYLEGFLTNPSANQAAWTFLKAHWKDLEPKLSVAFADVGVVQALGSFCDSRSRDDVKAFFATHKLGNAARNVDQSVERIDNCIELKEKQTPVLDAWLQTQK
jgi:aminopeptidase N